MEKSHFSQSQGTRYSFAIALCIVTMLIALPVHDLLDPANIVMLFLLAVFITAATLGRGPAILAAFLNVALFDFFFVQPRLSFAVADTQYLVTFAVMLAVGLCTSHLVARVAERKREAEMREQQTLALYDLAADLGTSLSIEQVAERTGTFLHGIAFDATVLIAESAQGETSFREYGKSKVSLIQLIPIRRLSKPIRWQAWVSQSSSCRLPHLCLFAACWQ